MAQKTYFPRKIVNNYLGLLEKHIKVNGVLLFGSFAYGNPDKHSDIDLAIISDNFKRKNFWKRVNWLTHMRKDVADSIAMDVIGYTPEEFNQAEKFSAILAQAKKQGKWLVKPDF